MPVTEVIQGTEEKTDVQATDVENQESNEQVIDETEGAEASQPETLVVTIGDQEPEAVDENLNFKQLRERAKELARENREFKRREAAFNASQQPSVLGAKPTLEGADYDTAKFEAELEAWQAKKIQLDAAAREQQTAQQKAAQAYQAKQAAYEQGRVTFKERAPDYDDAHEGIMESFNQTQQGVLLKGSKDPHMLVYALHKNQAKRKELAAITDPVEFAAELFRTEAQLKVSGRPTRQPEERVQGVQAVGRGGDQMLAKLQAEAAKTGDITKVVAYKREQRQKNQKTA